MRRLFIATLALTISVSASALGSIEDKLAQLHGPDQYREETILYRTCVPNKLIDLNLDSSKVITSICIHSTRTLDQSIHDFQIFQVVYRDGTSIEYGLLPFAVDPKTSHDLGKNVLKARIIARADTRLGASTIVEGTVYLVWERRGTSGLGSPAIIGRTPADEPFRGNKSSL
ncbi:MAG: hypothetical protein KDD43_05635 [Bdellovibrionales bacterium]|nr:hypothetical protein [Bdellovibrionales bacterium]